MSIRTFVAIELDDACRQRLGAAMRPLTETVAGVRWVDPMKAHLTLKFIGDLDERDLPVVIDALMDACEAATAFEIRLAGLSGFPPKGRGLRVVHVAVEEPTGALAALAESVELALEEQACIPRESRAFRAHVTLGRVKKPRECPSLEELAELLRKEDFGWVYVDEIVLMRSELTPQGPVYTALERVALGGEGQ